jgi:hypothetical protein
MIEIIKPVLMYILKFFPKSIEGMTLGWFICKSIVEANGMRTSTITLTMNLNSDGTEASMAVFTLNMPLNSCSRRPTMLKGFS